MLPTDYRTSLATWFVAHDKDSKRDPRKDFRRKVGFVAPVKP